MSNDTEEVFEGAEGEEVFESDASDATDSEAETIYSDAGDEEPATNEKSSSDAQLEPDSNAENLKPAKESGASASGNTLENTGSSWRFVRQIIIN